jgi:hypothetical protein
MKKARLIVFLLAATLAACGAQNKENDASGAKPKVPLDVKMNFSHEVHKKVMQKEGFDCFVCHPMNVKPKDEKSVEEAIKLSKQAFFPGKQTCHFCHYNSKASNNIAPGECSLCHFNMAEIEPKNHNFNWTEKHAIFAKANVESCQNCHAPKFCEDCHKRRDLPTIMVHDRNWRFVHGIEARANPRECGNCHEITFCNTCHTKGGYDY